MDISTVFDAAKSIAGAATGLGVDLVVNTAGAYLYQYVKKPSKVKKVLFAIGTNAIGGYLGMKCIEKTNKDFDNVKALIRLAQITEENKEEESNAE